METVFSNKYVHVSGLYTSREARSMLEIICWRDENGVSQVHNRKIANVGVGCASWRNYCRMPNLILVYSSTLELQNKRNTSFITTSLNFQWLFFIWWNFYINLETSTQLRYMSNTEMWHKNLLQLYFMHKTIK